MIQYPRYKRHRFSSFQVIIAGFAAVDLVGALLLMFPIATQQRCVTPFHEALFTSTSALCVTGLVVQDTGSYWSVFGQSVILLLIQIGGLGVITVGAAFALLSGRKISLKQRSTMQEATAAPQMGGIVRLTGFILRITALFELVGAALLLPTFCADYGLRGPKVKQNNTIGIRVVWTLQDEENWNATHRFSGKIWVASSILCMLCGLFAESIAALVLYIVSIMAAAIISVLYSYLFYKKKIGTGEKLKIQYNKKVIVVYGIVTILTIIFIIVTLFWGSIDIHFQDNNFTIEAQGWSDYTVAYTQIDSISYEENLLQNSNDYRTNGLGNFKYAMGNFRNDVYGNYIRYTHSSCHSYVVMSVDGKILVINGENNSATEEIYHTISEKMSRELE